MERRRAFVVAGSLTITAFTGSVVAGASAGLFGLGTTSGAATPRADVAPAARPEPLVVEITVPAPGGATVVRGGGGSGTPGAGAVSTAPASESGPSVPPALAVAPTVGPAVPSGARDTEHEDEDEDDAREHGLVSDRRENDD